MKQINTGINPEHWKKENHAEKDYYIGAVTKPVLFINGHGMDKYLPTGEYQCKNDEDKMCCVSMSHNNCNEIIGNYFGYKMNFNVLDFNLSDRFLATLSGTSHDGNSPNTVCETFRKKGFVFENVWPYPGAMSWDAYYSSIYNSTLNNALLNLAKVNYSHEWVEINPTNLKHALQFGPVQVIGYAWASENGIYKDYGYTPNHAFVIYDYEDGVCWKVFDSYTKNFQYDENDVIPADFTKLLDWNFKFGDYGKQMTFKLKAGTQTISLLSNIKNMFKNLSAYMDEHGLHLWYTEDRGRQEIPLTTMFEKALAISYVKEGIIKITTFPAIAPLPPYKFF